MTIPDMAAIAIGFAAVAVAFWTGVQNRRHHRLSVRPLLELGVRFKREDAPVGIFVENRGLGPAVLNTYQFSVDHKPLDSNDFDGFIEAVKEIGLFDPLTGFDWCAPGGALQPGATFWLISKTSAPSGNDHVLFKRAISRLGVRVEYASLYGTHHTAELGDTSELARHLGYSDEG